MAANELVYLSGAKLAAAIRGGEASPTEVVTAFLERIEAIDPKLNAFITVIADQAMARAARLEHEQAAGAELGPLHGVPYAAKDLFATRGIRTTNGSRTTADWVPDYESTATDRMNRAGAVLLGKTNLYEFAIGSEALSLAGPAHNPWHLDYSPEGSSSGSAVAVAASLTPLALGTETGGSIRKPAAISGVVGLKPTYGHVSRYGVSSASWSLDHVGPMTRSVADAAVMLQVLAGRDPKDESSVDESVPDYAAALSNNIQGVRIGLPERFFFEDLATDVEQAVRDAIEKLIALGAEPVTVEIPHAPLSVPAGWMVSMSEAATYHESRLQTSRDLFDPLVRERLEAARFYTATDYVKSQQLRTILKREVRDVFHDCDVMIMPTVTRIGKRIQSPDNAGTDVVEGAGEALKFAILAAVKTTIIGTMTGIPAISVPCGFATTPARLPIGVQFYARPFDEATLLRVAHAYESATQWHEERPVV